MAASWDIYLERIYKVVEDQVLNLNNESLVDFCSENSYTRTGAEEFLKKVAQDKKFPVKNSFAAEEHKKDGNTYLIEKKAFAEALSSYTKSIFTANKNDECLPLAYANRSLVLQEMGYFSESIQDIDMALCNGYPESKCGKLILRKAKCLMKLGDINKAQELLSMALRNLNEKDCQIFKRELKALKNLEKKTPVSETQFHLPEPAGGKNDNFVSASNHICVSYSKAKGRHVIATADIQIGDVLFVEKPFAFVTFETVCHRCCKKILAPIPCSNCCYVGYCSPKCRDEFWNSVHSFECGYSEFFKSVGIAYLSVRIIQAASSSFSQLKEIIGSMNVPKYEDGVLVLKKNDYTSVYNLVTNLEKYEKSDLFQYVMTALLLALFMKNNTNYLPSNSDEDLKLLTNTICRHILQLICNGHAIVNVFVEGSQGKSVLDETEKRIGTAIYPSASMMNHSCEPSIINSFYKDYLIVRASKVIRKGEEVFNCYGPHAKRTRRKERQEILSKQYFFKCECQACVSNYDIQEIFTALKCEKCKGPLVPREENSKDKICLNCSYVCEISPEISTKELEFFQLIKLNEFLIPQHVPEALANYVKAWLIGRKIFYKFHKDLSYAASEIARCMVLLGDYRKSVMFLKCSVLSVEYRFGSFSIELANEIKKLGDAITNYTNMCQPSEIRDIVKEGIRYYQKAYEIISILFGSQHDDLQDIKANKKVLEEILKDA